PGRSCRSPGTPALTARPPSRRTMAPGSLAEPGAFVMPPPPAASTAPAVSAQPDCCLVRCTSAAVFLQGCQLAGEVLPCGLLPPPGTHAGVEQWVLVQEVVDDGGASRLPVRLGDVGVLCAYCLGVPGVAGRGAAQDRQVSVAQQSAAGVIVLR